MFLEDDRHLGVLIYPKTARGDHARSWREIGGAGSQEGVRMVFKDRGRKSLFKDEGGKAIDADKLLSKQEVERAHA